MAKASDARIARRAGAGGRAVSVKDLFCTEAYAHALEIWAISSRLRSTVPPTLPTGVMLGKLNWTVAMARRTRIGLRTVVILAQRAKPG